LVILFFIVFIGMVGFGIILPIFPFYAERVGASPTVITWTMAAFTLGQAFATPIWGRISDAYGRRLVLILTMLGSALSYIMLAYADALWLVITSRVFGGLMAGNIATAFAYVTDITTDENRPAGLGKVGAAMGLGFIFGPATGGLLAGAEVETANFVAPALAAAGVSLLTMFATMLFLPESLPESDRRPLFGARGGTEKASLSAVNRSGLLKLIIAALVFYVGMAQMESIFPIWGKDMFAMGPRDIGAVFFVLGIVTVIMQGGLIGPLSRRFGEKRVALAAGLFFSTGLTCMALATEYWHLWAALVPFGMGVGLFNPTISSMVSKTASANERGAIMGRYQSASAMGRVIGPLICGPLYTFVGTGAPFMLGAVIMLPVLWLVSQFVLKAESPPSETVA
jgi:DHA1 family tetracycline resistance protein-like MFS transporter